MASRRGQRIKPRPEGCLVAIIGDEDTVTGMLLAGVGHLDAKKRPNFLVVDNKTTKAQIEEAFKSFTTRDDIGIILISQHIADDIRHLLDDYDKVIPTVLEIPSKNHPYDPTKDFMMTRIKKMMGVRNA